MKRYIATLWILVSLMIVSCPASDEEIETFVPGTWVNNNGEPQSYFYNEEALFVSGYQMNGRMDELTRRHSAVKLAYFYNCGVLYYKDIQDLQGFRGLTHLKIVDGSITDRHLLALSETHIAANLEFLYIIGSYITDEGLLTLAENNRFGKLRKLSFYNDLTVSRITIDGLNRLAATDFVTRLESFSVTLYPSDKEINLSEAYLKKLCPKTASFETFCNKKIGNLERYMAFDPEFFRYRWRFFENQWYLCCNKDPKTTDLLIEASDKLLKYIGETTDDNLWMDSDYEDDHMEYI
ncbi:MAG: hypothetical protein KBB83_06425 [Alphaproteobacteria bacterium]|nr:hypothetical protein [Alphaproteobacteria bacterium]